MANENDLTVQQVGTSSTGNYVQPEEKVEKPKKVKYNIGAAMLAAQDGGIGAGIEAGVERKLKLSKNSPTYIDFKADGSLYTSSEKRANIYTGLKVEHHSDYRYRPIVTDMGIEARYIQNNSEQSLTTHFGDNYEGFKTTDYSSQNLQLNQKFGMEYETKNKKFTLGAGVKGGINIPLNNGFELSDSYTEVKDVEIQTSEGPKTAQSITEYSAGMSLNPEVLPNVSAYLNADYKVNNKLSLGLSGEYGNHNKEIKFGAKYNF